MALQIYTRDKTSPGGFQWIWFIRFFQIVITLIVLGITAANVTSFHDIGCSAPGKLDFNLAVVRFRLNLPIHLSSLQSLVCACANRYNILSLCNRPTGNLQSPAVVHMGLNLPRRPAPYLLACSLGDVEIQLLRFVRCVRLCL